MEELIRELRDEYIQGGLDAIEAHLLFDMIRLADEKITEQIAMIADRMPFGLAKLNFLPALHAFEIVAFSERLERAQAILSASGMVTKTPIGPK